MFIKIVNMFSLVSTLPQDLCWTEGSSGSHGPGCLTIRTARYNPACSTAANRFRLQFGPLVHRLVSLEREGWSDYRC